MFRKSTVNMNGEVALTLTASKLENNESEKSGIP